MWTNIARTAAQAGRIALIATSQITVTSVVSDVIMHHVGQAEETRTKYMTKEETNSKGEMFKMIAVFVGTQILIAGITYGITGLMLDEYDTWMSVLLPSEEPVALDS